MKITGRTKKLFSFGNKKILEAVFFCPVLLFLFLIFLLVPLLLPELPDGIELDFHLARITSAAQAMQEGNFPVLIDYNDFSGYGHAGGLFRHGILLLPAVLLVNAGLHVVTACKILMAAACLFAAFSAFYAVWEISRDPYAAFAGGLLYGTCSCFASCLFVRCAVDEFLAMAFLPWIILGLWQIIYRRRPLWGAFAFGFAGVLAAHLPTAFIAAVFCSVFFICNIKRITRKPRRLFAAIWALVLAAGLNFYWIMPLVINCFQTDFACLNNFSGNYFCVPFTRLFLETPYLAGDIFIPAGAGVIFVVLLLRRWRFGSPGLAVDRFRDLVMLSGGCALLGATDILPWEWNFPGAEIIAYPWRLFSIASCALAAGGALLLAGIFARDKRKRQFWMIIITAGALSGWSFTTVYAYFFMEKNQVMEEMAPDNYDFLPAGFNTAVFSDTAARIYSGSGEVEIERTAPDEFMLYYTKERDFPTVVELPVTGLSGWYVYMQEQPPYPAGYTENGLVSVRIPAGHESGTVRVFRRGTDAEKVAAGISICFLTFSLGTLILNKFCIISFKRNKKKR